MPSTRSGTLAYQLSMNLTKSLLWRLSPEKLHGLFFDVAILLGNLSLFRAFPALGDSTDASTGGVFLLLALLTQLAGAVLKRAPLTGRLRQLEPGPVHWTRNWMDVLLFLHFVLFTVITVAGLAFTGIYDLGQTTRLRSDDWWVLVSFAAAGTTTYLVWRAGKPESRDPELSPMAIRLEYLADGLLWISAGIVTRAFWGGLILLLEPSRGGGLNLQSLILLLAMSALFVFFYLPVRYLFLIEDYRSPWTWVQVWAAMLPVAWLLLLG